MNIINAVLSLAVAVFDWAQQSPNYQRGTHQRWPAAASHRMHCVFVYMEVHTHAHALILDKKKEEENKEGEKEARKNKK